MSKYLILLKTYLWEEKNIKTPALIMVLQKSYVLQSCNVPTANHSTDCQIADDMITFYCHPIDPSQPLLSFPLNSYQG